MYVLYNNRDGKMNNERIILNERSMFWKEGTHTINGRKMYLLKFESCHASSFLER